MRVIAASVALLISVAAFAQEYPSKPLRIIVPVPPGGANDTLTRIVAPKLSELLKQPVEIENRGGANTTLGTALVAKAPPDGYTLLSAPSAHTVNPALYSNLSYDAIRDFAPIAGIAAAPLFLAVHPTLPVKSVKELVALARSKPGQLNYASPGNGTSGHLAGELFKSVANVTIVHVPYKGGGPATIDLVGGHVLMMFPTLQASMPYVRAGKLRALAVTSANRTALAPDLPTMKEAGFPGVEVGSWFALLAPAGLPRDVVAKLDSGVRTVLQANDVAERLKGLGYESFYMGPDPLAAYLKSDLARWGKVVRAAGIKAE
ncbi:MAG TPA: tripartite tricarboxylate transporter substrate binding protein [Burkholderiales bacterium]|nr:tripartite tricarboxylate transporter substrate binding protein [Burkholderiales bacterium]